MPLLFNKKICFVHIPKTGGTTIERVLCDHSPGDFALFWASEPFQKKLGSPIHPSPIFHEKFTLQAKEMGLPEKCSPQHYTYSDIKLLCPDLDSWFSFAFVRNPWERIFSEWKYVRVITETERSDFSDFVAQVETVLQSDRHARNNHYRPQVDFLAPNVRIYRYENFASQALDLFAELGIYVDKLPHIYRATEKDEYKKYYDSALISRVGAIYRNDIDAFGYDFTST